MALQEGRHPAEFVLSEANGQRSRDNITIGENQDFVAGTVLGKLTADGSFVAFNAGGADGSQNAAAIPLYPAKTGDGESVKISAITGDAEVNGKILTWPAGATDVQKNAAIAALAAIGIKVR
jgi:head decoration protein D